MCRVNFPQCCIQSVSTLSPHTSSTHTISPTFPHTSSTHTHHVPHTIPTQHHAHTLSPSTSIPNTPSPNTIPTYHPYTSYLIYHPYTISHTSLHNPYIHLSLSYTHTNIHIHYAPTPYTHNILYLSSNLENHTCFSTAAESRVDSMKNCIVYSSLSNKKCNILLPHSEFPQFKSYHLGSP